MCGNYKIPPTLLSQAWASHQAHPGNILSPHGTRSSRSAASYSRTVFSGDSDRRDPATVSAERLLPEQFYSATRERFSAGANPPTASAGWNVLRQSAPSNLTTEQPTKRPTAERL